MAEQFAGKVRAQHRVNQRQQGKRRQDEAHRPPAGFKNHHDRKHTEEDVARRGFAAPPGHVLVFDDEVGECENRDDDQPKIDSAWTMLRRRAQRGISQKHHRRHQHDERRPECRGGPQIADNRSDQENAVKGRQQPVSDVPAGRKPPCAARTFALFKQAKEYAQSSCAWFGHRAPGSEVEFIRCSRARDAMQRLPRDTVAISEPALESE
ncbi:MAG: hypothetical protein GEU91_01585 [Rhizobiales bacterium]|nr:hypothetical protein [Hyphomicrobiales bacterium]